MGGKKREKNEEKEKSAHNFVKTGEGGGSKAIYKLYKKKNRRFGTGERL